MRNNVIRLEDDGRDDQPQRQIHAGRPGNPEAMPMYPERVGGLVFRSTPIEVFIINKNIDKSNDDEKLMELPNEVSPRGVVKKKKIGK